jgi:hypothetical protein
VLSRLSVASYVEFAVVIFLSNMEHASSSKVPNAVLGALSVLCAFEKSEDMKSFSSSHNSSSGATEKCTGPLRESPSPCVDLSFAYVSGKPWRDCAVVSFCTCVCATSVEVLDVDDRLGEGADFGLSGLRTGGGYEQTGKNSSEENQKLKRTKRFQNYTL